MTLRETHKFLNNIKIVTFPTAGMYIEAYTKSTHHLKDWPIEDTHFISNIRLEILISSNIHTYTSVLEPFCFDFIRVVGDGRDDYIRHGKALLESVCARMNDMMGVVFTSCSGGVSMDGRTFGVFLRCNGKVEDDGV